MAQELLSGQVGKHSDVFSLGVTLYEMVTNQVGDLPGEGQPWHRLREGEVDMEEYMIGSSTPTPTISSCSSSDSLEAERATALSTGSIAPASLSESISTQPYKRRKLFSNDLLGIIKEMLQPAFEQRPTAAAILKHPAIQQGMRSEEAMSGLLLQSI